MVHAEARFAALAALMLTNVVSCLPLAQREKRQRQTQHNLRLSVRRSSRAPANENLLASLLFLLTLASYRRITKRSGCSIVGFPALLSRVTRHVAGFILVELEPVPIRDKEPQYRECKSNLGCINGFRSAGVSGLVQHL